MEQIFRKIKKKQSDFSKGFKKIADFFYRDPQVFAMNSAKQAGKLIGVSETTIIRFAYELGYSGYSTLQQDVQNQLFNKSTLSGYLDSKTISDEDIHPTMNLMLQNIQMTRESLQNISHANLDTLVTKLMEADLILSCGVRISHAFASWFAFALDLIRGNSRLYQSSTDDILLRLSELTEESVVVAFSFHRYAINTIQIAKLAKRKGAYVITFTDSPFAPITEYADLVLPIQWRVKSTLDIAPTVFTLMNGIVSAISLRDEKKFQERIKQFDSMDADDLFVQDYLKDEKN